MYVTTHIFPLMLTSIACCLSLVLVFTSVLCAEAQKCSPGSYSPSGKAPCTPCPSGTYQTRALSRSCKEADPGFFAAGPGATYQIKCPEGYYSIGGVDSCTACPTGSSCLGLGNSSPTYYDSYDDDDDDEDHVDGDYEQVTLTRRRRGGKPSPSPHVRARAAAKPSQMSHPSPRPLHKGVKPRDPSKSRPSPSPRYGLAPRDPRKFRPSPSPRPGLKPRDPKKTRPSPSPRPVIKPRDPKRPRPSPSPRPVIKPRDPRKSRPSPSPRPVIKPRDPKSKVRPSPRPTPSPVIKLRDSRGKPLKPSPSPRYEAREARLQSRNVPLTFDEDTCAFGYNECPVYGVALGGAGFMGDYVCVDTKNDLESCGGCVLDDSPHGEVGRLGGRDCSAIPNVDSVRCARSKCIIEKCQANYALTEDGSRCRPVF